MNKKVLTLFALVVTVLIAGYFVYRGNSGAGDSSKLKVSASFYPMYYFASRIGGDMAAVTNITPSGSEPHDYEPTPADIANIEKGKILILNGGGLEPWASDIEENLDSAIVIINTGEGLISREVEEEGERVKDPHVWLSPILAKKQVEKILAGFIEVDPNNRTFYEDNAAGLITELDTLDQQYQTGLAACKQKDVFTSHEAFGYLAESYSLNQVAISGISPDEEPSSKQVAQVANLAREKEIKYIFFETLVSPKLSETVASEIGAKTLVLDPIEGIADDEIKKGENYVTKMEANLANLKVALECN